jgi:hypothetical protein
LNRGGHLFKKRRRDGSKKKHKKKTRKKGKMGEKQARALESVIKQ